ncbi:hypothetical protein ACIPF8_06870 [Collimonas sp. NPDC087041]|uniref:hypothetical protein n=1 Tax=Collimonas sp. NPDC087041 TaxID=3363960 RepID=UPI0037F4D284
MKRALRSLNPKYGKNKRDSAARSALAARLSKELLNGRQIHREAVYPGFEEKWGRSHAQGLGIKVPAESFRRFSEKIVRGVYFVDGERLIEPPYVIEFFALSDQGAKPIQDLVERYGREMSLGTAIVVRIAEADEDRMCSLIEISIWGKFKMYCSVDLDNDSIT